MLELGGREDTRETGNRRFKGVSRLDKVSSPKKMFGARRKLKAKGKATSARLPLSVTVDVRESHWQRRNATRNLDATEGCLRCSVGDVGTADGM